MFSPVLTLSYLSALRSEGNPSSNDDLTSSILSLPGDGYLGAVLVLLLSVISSSTRYGFSLLLKFDLSLTDSFYSPSSLGEDIARKGAEDGGIIEVYYELAIREFEG